MGYLSLILHAHLPFVRHPEQERFLEESWLFEAIVETYIPLLEILESWQRDQVKAHLTLTLSPTLCSMLQDPLLQERCARRLDALVALTAQELQRTHWERPFNELAAFYRQHLAGIIERYESCGRDLVGAFKRLQDAGQLEIITTSATHAVLPLLADDPHSLRAQVLVARDHYRRCFGRDPRGIWLPECAYAEAIEPVLREAGLRWFILETHGILHARPQPRYGTFAPIITPTGLAAFGRDSDSARQVWSRREGYPGDPRYRDFYRDAGFDLDLDYINPYLPAHNVRGFTGLKYYRITGPSTPKGPYDRQEAIHAVDEHAAHFLSARISQVLDLARILDRSPLVVCPYDAELFGHWWYEGPQFLDFLVRKAAFDQKTFELITPEEYLGRHAVNQAATPAASSWGENGYWGVWLNEKNQWIYPHLRAAQGRMHELVNNVGQASRLPLSEGSEAEAVGTREEEGAGEAPALLCRALKQAGRELLLAQASDWPFMLSTGTNDAYARKRVEDHLLRFNQLYEQIRGNNLDENWLSEIEEVDNVFPDLDFGYWG